MDAAAQSLFTCSLHPAMGRQTSKIIGCLGAASGMEKTAGKCDRDVAVRQGRGLGRLVLQCASSIVLCLGPALGKSWGVRGKFRVSRMSIPNSLRVTQAAAIHCIRNLQQGLSIPRILP